MERSGPKKCGDAGYKTKAGKPCGNDPLKGRIACKFHVGEPTSVAKAKGQIKLIVDNWGPDAPLVNDVPHVMLVVFSAVYQMWRTVQEGIKSEVMDKDLAALVGTAWSEGGKTGEYVTGLMELSLMLSDRVMKYGEVWERAGFDRKQLELQEQQIDQLDAILRLAVVKLGAVFGFTADDPRVVDAVVTSMRELPAG